MDELMKSLLPGLGVGGIITLFAYMMLRNMIAHQSELMGLIREYLTRLNQSQDKVTDVLGQVATKLEELCRDKKGGA